MAGCIWVVLLKPPVLRVILCRFSLHTPALPRDHLSITLSRHKLQFHLPKQLVTQCIYWGLFSAVDRYPFGALVSRTVLCVGIIQNKLHSHTCDALQQSILIVFYGTEEYQALATRTILGSIDLKTRGRIHSPLLTLLVPAAVLLLLFFFSLVLHQSYAERRNICGQHKFVSQFILLLLFPGCTST